MSVAIPPVYEKDTKIFVWNCALRSSSGVVFDCCAPAHIGSCTRARSGEKHCLFRSADLGVLVEGSFFFTPRVLCFGSREPRLTAMGIRCAEHVTPSIRRSWH
jgi:hypothetical protein